MLFLGERETETPLSLASWRPILIQPAIILLTGCCSQTGSWAPRWVINDFSIAHYSFPTRICNSFFKSIISSNRSWIRKYHLNHSNDWCSDGWAVKRQPRTRMMGGYSRNYWLRHLLLSKEIQNEESSATYLIVFINLLIWDKAFYFHF